MRASAVSMDALAPHPPSARGGLSGMVAPSVHRGVLQG